MVDLSTSNVNTWCPGCTNFRLLDSVNLCLSRMIEKGMKQEQFAMAAGIGCHAKTFDYLNISGVYGLHGRTIPLATGIKMGNPDLKVIAFAGDGDTYAEGMEHFIHACRFNPDLTLIVHDNRDFSLTGGQSTPTTQQGYKSKANPHGEMNPPLNPIRLALAAGAGFVARCNARDVEHTAEVLEQAMNYKGFSFVEVIQDCIIFNTGLIVLDKMMHKVNNKNLKKAFTLADEWDYNSRKGKIPIGIIFSKEKETLGEKLSAK